jgi:hypothetical protein
MDSRKITKYLILVITILVAELLSSVVLNYVHFSKNAHRPYYSTALGMLITVIVYTPLLSLMQAIIESMAATYVKKTKKVAGGSIQGVLLASCLAIGILYCFYLYVWYKIDVRHLLR